MAIQMEKPRIHVKTKNLQQLFDYCIESKTEFTVIPKNSNDTWEIELAIKSIMDAIKWGMYLKANKIDLVENPLIETVNSTIVSKPVAQNVKPKTQRKGASKIENPANPLFNESTEKNDEMYAKTETEQVGEISLLSFEENKNQPQQNELF